MSLVTLLQDKSLQDISGVMISSGSPAFDIQNWLQGRPGFSYEDWKKSAKLGIPTTTTQSAQGEPHLFLFIKCEKS